MMTGLDRISYQSRWRHIAPEWKFLLWLLLMVLAFTLPVIGRVMTLLFTAALTCFVARISLWRWCRWMALPFGFLLVGVLTILFSIGRDPQSLWWGISIGHYWLGMTPSGLITANDTFWRSLCALSATFWLVLTLPFDQLIVLLQRARCRA